MPVLHRFAPAAQRMRNKHNYTKAKLHFPLYSDVGEKVSKRWFFYCFFFLWCTIVYTTQLFLTFVVVQWACLSSRGSAAVCCPLALWR